MRKTLEKYYGKRVMFVGTYEGSPKRHEETGIKFDSDLQDYPKYRSNTEIPENPEPSKLSYVSPIGFPETASCLKDVRGIGEFFDIREDHVNIQSDLKALWNLKEGESVKLECLVGRYKKRGGYDYCLVEAQRILSYNERGKQKKAV